MSAFQIGCLIAVSAVSLSLVIVIATACRLAAVKARKEAIIEVNAAGGPTKAAFNPKFHGNPNN